MAGLRILSGGRIVTVTLGSYQLGEVLGRGAMGEVHRAARAGADDPVAVKVLRPEFTSDRA